MDPITFVGEKIKGFASFIDGVIHRISNSSDRNPIEILKRLQGETIPDLMKLRDRQDKLERALYNTSSKGGSPFNVRGDIEAVGGLLMMSDADQDPFGQAGINPGINLRLIFETTGREKDSLAAEFVARQNGDGDVYGGDVSGTALRLTKVSYLVNINHWLSAIAIPLQARFRDLADSSHQVHFQRHGLTDLSFLGPPLLNQHNDAAVGITLRTSSLTACIAQSMSGVGRQQLYPESPDRFPCCFNTFCQIACRLPLRFRLSLLGLQKVRREASAEGFSAAMEDATGCFALKLESEIGQSARIGGWIEMNNADPRHLQWAVDAIDDSAEGLGWGVSFSGGAVEGDGRWRRLQGESYLKVNLGRNVSLKPGIAWTFDSDDDSRTLALMLRSNWTL